MPLWPHIPHSTRQAGHGSWPAACTHSCSYSLKLGNAGIPELVELLRQQGKAVFLVSGGFHAIIDPIAQHLGLPPDHVFANVILFKVHTRRTLPAWPSACLCSKLLVSTPDITPRAYAG